MTKRLTLNTLSAAASNLPPAPQMTPARRATSTAPMMPSAGRISTCVAFLGHTGCTWSEYRDLEARLQGQKLARGEQPHVRSIDRYLKLRTHVTFRDLSALLRGGKRLCPCCHYRNGAEKQRTHEDRCNNCTEDQAHANHNNTADRPTNGTRNSPSIELLMLRDSEGPSLHVFVHCVTRSSWQRDTPMPPQRSPEDQP